MSIVEAPRPLLDYAEVARLLNIPAGTLRWHVHQGRIPFIRLGPRTVRFSPDVIDEILRGERSLYG